MVIFRTPEGKPGYQPAETVQDAVAVVERLRNDEGVENVRIFRLEELTFEYRPYYKVELAGLSSDADASAPSGFLDEPAPVAHVDEAHAAADGAIDVGHEEVEANAESSASVDSSDEAAGDDDLAEPLQASEQPPWAAPPPPPPGPSTDGVFGGESGGDEEFSSAAQRRGLFGR